MSMAEDLVERLRDYRVWNHARHRYDAVPLTLEAADAIEAQMQVISELREETGELVVCQYTLSAVEARVEKTERALAEAVEVLRPFAAQADAWPQIPDNQAMMTSNGEDLSALDMPMSALRAARVFVKEHGSDSTEGK